MNKKHKSDITNFGYLGRNFQVRLLAHILTDHRFGNSILDILTPTYFDDEFLKIIAASIIDAWGEDEYIPDHIGLEIRLMDDIKNEQVRELVRVAFEEVKNASLAGDIDIKKRALNFCKQQALKETVGKIQNLIDKGDIDRYHECEDLLRKALEVGDNKDDSIDVFNGIDEVLDDDFRKPIPTGIHGLDIHMDGGLADSELGVILAPFGVGKTSMVTKIANTAKNMGKNVLQIFFEDNPKVIQRKHLTCWYNQIEDFPNININELKDYKEDVKKVAFEQKNKPGVIKLKKFPSDGTTIPKIRQYVRKLIASGFRPDMILLDYIDCVLPSRKFDDQYAGEGNVMRQFETMLSEFEVTGWTCVQGNRCLALDTKVDILNKGLIEIGDVKEGDKILTHKGYKDVIKVFEVQKRPVYKIKTRGGKEIKASAKHKFPTNKGLLSIDTGLEFGVKLLINSGVINTSKIKEVTLNLDDFNLDEIISIELIGEKDTVDISVEDTQMFYANEIYTHNSSLNAERVDSTMIGGSIKRGQIGHFIVSIAKTLDQKEEGTATMAILKSRFGKDGIIFEDCIFDNGKLIIDTSGAGNGKTFIEAKKESKKYENDRIASVLTTRKKMIEKAKNEVFDEVEGKKNN